jgi:type IV secretory pathway TrbD component
MSERVPHIATPDRTCADGPRLAGIALLALPVLAAVTARPVALSLAHWIVIAFGLALYRIGARSARSAPQRDDAEGGRDAS